ncbi:MAG TPA: helix-turn-helix domain-containing protein [Victivallales bacterium]|nr:helix-turn-helix domain-containing protein [Victivallales bacterium]
MKIKIENLKKIRKEKRWTLQALATELNLSRFTLYKWENGTTTPTLNKLSQLAGILDVPINIISDLEVEYEHVREKERESIDSWELIGGFEDKKLKHSVDAINENIDFLKRKLKETSLLINGLIHSSPNPAYIKNRNNKYIIANDAFLKLIDLPSGYTVYGKSDEDLFNPAEAKSNSSEDSKVMITGESVIAEEKYTPGSRKKNWCLSYKKPILDSDSNIIGIRGALVDITVRKKNQRLRKILENVLTLTDENIWVFKDIAIVDGITFFKNMMYSSDNAIKNEVFGDSNGLTWDEQIKIWRSMIVDEDVKNILNFDKTNCPVLRNYRIHNKKSNKTYQVKSKVHYNQEYKVFILLATFTILGNS